MVEKELTEKIRQYEDAVRNLQISHNLSVEELNEDVADSVKSGQIQKFEVCIELFWKTLKKYLTAMHGIEAKSPKETVKKGLEMDMYSYEFYETLIDMLNWRNELSHLYSKEKFETLRRSILEVRPVWAETLRILGRD